MAKQVSEILVKLGIQGFEGLDKLKSSFRGLEKAIGPTDSAIQTARQSIIDFAGAGKQSIQSIQGQIEAFKGLQTQATIGGNVYRQLAGDVNRLSDTLKQLKNDYEEVGRAAKQTDKQIAAQFPARRPEAFRQQLAALNRQLDQLSVSGREYAEVLTEITIRETAFGRAQSRQRVIAGAEAVGAPLIGAMQPKQQLPNTLAALQLRISELTQDFQNLDRAGQPYQDTLSEINRLQNELSRATEDGNADRKEEIRARIENYRQLTAENAALREQAAIRRSVERGRARAAGARVIEQPMRQISGLYEQIGQIGMQPILGDIEMMGNSYTRVSNDIKRATNASNGSIQSLNAQRNAWQMLRVQLDPASAGFAKASRQIEELDRRLGKLQQTQGRRMGGMQMAQAAGAAISGGIFGGPEGFLGGAIGGIAGGVGGAFVGAAAGAQVGMLRQQLGGFADYAAQIQKMKIALEGAAGSQDQFNQAMAAANSVVRSLNVPQDVAIQGMTKLTAAVKGAGGQVSDAELVFKNVTAAIKGTGGSAEDVDGAITAMVQVFSKGKVSAEELSGQLGERLPGAVTKFAQANDMTLPELQKALEQGQVGLNELMNFIVQLGDEYSGVAQKIAGSSQDAGARLTVAYNDMRVAIGEALQPIGAEFQEAFIPFIEGITPALVDILPKIGQLMLAIAKNFDTAAIAVGAFMAVLAISRITTFTSAAAGLIGLLVGIKTAAAGAATAMTGFAAASMAVPWIALAAGAAAASVAIYNAATAQQEFNKKIYEAPLADVQVEIRKLESDLAAAEQKLLNTTMQFGALSREAAFAQSKVDALRGALNQAQGDYKVRLLYERVGVTPDPRFFGPGFAAPAAPPKPSKFPRLDEGKAGSAGKSKQERESQLPQLMAQLAVQEQIAQINARIRDAQIAENQFLQIRLEGERDLAQIAGDIKAIAFEKIPADEAEIKRKLLMLKADEARANIAQRLAQADKQALKEVTQQSDELGQNYAKQINQRKRLQELIGTGMKEALALEFIQIESILEKEKERLEVQKALLQAVVDAGGPGAKEAQAGITSIDSLLGGLGGKETELKDLAAEAQPGEIGKLQEFIKQAEAELKDLEAVAVRISQNIGDAVGSSIASGISGLIEGTTTVKQIFANFLRDVGQILVQEGAKMIATYIAIGIAKIFAGLASGGTGSKPTAPASPIQSGADFGIPGKISTGIFAAADGAAFAQNGVQPFANGGIVTRPTFFKYANGGTFNNGVMGEAGPEAIMPLRRNSSGKLGVDASGLREAMGSTPISSQNNAPMLNMSFETTNIGGVEYVSRDQLEAAMAATRRDAARDGAKRGMSMTLDKLQQSPGTRGRVGLR